MRPLCLIAWCSMTLDFTGMRHVPKLLRRLSLIKEIIFKIKFQSREKSKDCHTVREHFEKTRKGCLCF